MLAQNELKTVLESQINILSDLAVECIESVIQVKCKINEPWMVVDRLPGEFEHIIHLGNGNEIYQAVMAIGMSNSDAKDFVDFETEEELLDIFGEVANIYCGMLMDKKEFTEKFGILTQSMPQYTSLQVFFPKASACYGKVYKSDTISITVGYAIRKLNYMQF